MISAGATSCFPNVSQGLPPAAAYPLAEDHHVVSSTLHHQEPSSGPTEAHSNSLLYSLSLLKDKVHQVQSLVSILISSDQSQQPESTSIAIASMGTMIQEIIVTASSMMFTCQQMAIGTTNSGNNNATTTDELHHQRGSNNNKVQETGLPLPNFGGNNRMGSNIGQERGQTYFGEAFDWYGDNNFNNSCNTNHDTNNRGTHVTSNNRVERREGSRGGTESISDGGLRGKSPNHYDIIELDAADLLAKYTHYCQVCGKGFKRDANLRMHMRAHGDEYKTSAALSNPMKNNNAGAMGEKDSSITKLPRKYSCPQEGCRWNQKHAKFQPLKSMICVKNHYKRSHCPKMYVCKRCNRKQFSVLSDLRTHEKHCGDLKWQCSCGTTFSRKDKLMGHVALFVGHTPAITSMTTKATVGKAENQAMQMQLDDRG